MKKTSKMAAAGVLAAMMALSLAACGGSSNSGAPAPAETQADGSVKTEGRTMKVLNPEEPGAEDALNKAMEAWAAEEAWGVRALEAMEAAEALEVWAAEEVWVAEEAMEAAEALEV